MKINFVLPFYSRFPGGGIKIMYEYANRLTKLGHDVVIYHCIDTPYTNYPITRPFFIRKIIQKVFYGSNPKPEWFLFDDRVTLCFIDRVEQKVIRDADIIISTWWSIVEPISKLPDSKGQRINLVQGYEIWEGNEELVHDSYKFSNVNYLAISQFLKSTIEKYNGEDVSTLIYNSISLDAFKITTPIEERDNFHIGMLYSDNDSTKGTIYGIEALKRLKEKYKNLRCTFFGIFPLDKERIPEWVTYHRNPNNLVSLYNSFSIFVSPSVNEGFGLTPVEAMACGCAVVATNIPGHRAFLSEGSNLCVTPSDVDDLFLKISQLLMDEGDRIKMAKAGNELVQKFDWENGVTQMENYMKSLI